MEFFFKKRKRLLEADIRLLSNVFNVMPSEYNSLNAQIEGGLLHRRLASTNVVRNYVGFSYTSGKSRYFEKLKERDYVLHGLEIFNISENKYTALDIFVASGLIAGYAAPHASDFKPDIQRVRSSNIHREYLDELNSKDLSKLFDEEELNLLNRSQIYEVELGGITFYHIEELEDGDFIGMDREKRVYTIRHDPYEIVPLDKSLREFLKI